MRMRGLVYASICPEPALWLRFQFPRQSATASLQNRALGRRFTIVDKVRLTDFLPGFLEYTVNQIVHTIV